MEVDFQVGPIDAEPARLWLGASIKIVEGMRAKPSVVPFELKPQMLDLIQMYLTLWSRTARQAVFLWAARTDAMVVEQVAREWRRISAMSDHDMEGLGCSWPTAESVPFHVALLEGVTAALDRDQRLADFAADLRARPPGTPIDALGGWT